MALRNVSHSHVSDTPNREVMAHLKAIVFIRPTIDNLAMLKKELRKPKYGEYYLCMRSCCSVSYSSSFYQCGF